MEDLGFGFKIFLMWTIFKIFAKLATALLWSYILFFLAARHVGSSSSTRGRTHIPCNGRQGLNHWTTREVPLGSNNNQITAAGAVVLPVTQQRGFQTDSTSAVRLEPGSDAVRCVHYPHFTRERDGCLASVSGAGAQIF